MTGEDIGRILLPGGRGLEDRRAHYRFAVPVPGTFTLDGHSQRPLKVVNISQGGLLAEASGPIPVPRRAKVRLQLGAESIELEAVCLRADYEPPYRAAFYFLSDGDEALDRLQVYLSKAADPDVH